MPKPMGTSIGPGSVHWEARVARWVQPRLLTEVEYTEVTLEGPIRHASFKGLREDKGARQVHLRARTPRQQPSGSAGRLIGVEQSLAILQQSLRNYDTIIQKEVATADAAATKPKKKAMQAGAREYPEPPFPKQHQAKPGSEFKLDPPPMYDAPFYLGSRKLQGKVALITGGDSGIGRAVAVLFAREGADIAIAHLAEDRDAEETKAAVEKEGRRAIAIKGDVRGRAFCQDAVAKTVDQLGRLDVLVNNAAFQVHTKKIEDLSEEHFDETLKTNLYGYFFMAQAAAKVMKAGSAIINTGSVTGIEGSPALLDNSMTKGGVHAFTRSLAGQLMERGIRVNCVAPGPVWTPLNPADKEAEEVSEFGSKVPMKRPA